ncbi:MAG: RNase P modulator RnpM [bacterium]|jgi:predicted RNA-binding protein YlxR (DUF448 family)
MKPKRELIRIVLTPENEILIDPTSKKSGRGAYLCPNAECLRQALKRKSFERALKTAIPRNIIEELGQGLGENEAKGN